MVRADNLPFRLGDFFAGAAHRALPDAGRHTLRRALLHGAHAHRAEVRHGPRALAGDASRLYATAGARVVALFHVAAFQTHAAQRYSSTRTFARGYKVWMGREP